MSLITPTLTLSIPSTSKTRIEFTIEGSINWDEVVGGDQWVLFLYVIEQDQGLDNFTVNAQGTYSPFLPGDDYRVIQSPIAKTRPAAGGREDFSYEFTRSRFEVGADWWEAEAFRAKCWLFPEAAKVYNSGWSGTVSVDL